MSGDLEMGPGAEFDLIRSLTEEWGALCEGIGDDAAIVTLPAGDSAVLTVDTAIEGVHFRREWITPREIGWRAAAAAISDIAAMGARPRAILLSLVVPRGWLADVVELGAGVGAAAAEVGARIVGGNVARGGELSLTTTVIGTVWAGAALRRDGARPGDRLYVTGHLGGPGRAVREWLGGRVPLAQDRERFARPVPRVAEGRWLAANGATAAIDISDGLAGDSAHLATASAVTVEIDTTRIPCVEGAVPGEALVSGEEYELLVTARGRFDIEEFERRFGTSLTEIGMVKERAGDGGCVRLLGATESVATPRGYDHLSE